MADAPIPLAGGPVRAAGFDAPSRQDGGAAELRRSAEEFEAVFLSEMLAPMFEGLDSDGLGGGGMGEQIFRPMLIERYAEAVSKAGGVGIAESVVREMLRVQSGAARETGDGTDD